MKKPKRIIDNQSTAELLKQLKGLETLESLYRLVPFARKIFPKLERIFTSFSDIKQEAEILLIPDRFNELFGQLGWIAYESLSTDVMKQAIALAEAQDLVEAEQFLSSSYDEDCVRLGIQRFTGNIDFGKRIRLAQLAKEDYLKGRYHACIPLLLCLLDGLVNDVSKHVGFFHNQLI